MMGTRSWIGVGEAHATSRPWRPARRQVQADPPSPKPPRFPFGSAAPGRKGGGLATRTIVQYKKRRGACRLLSVWLLQPVPLKGLEAIPQRGGNAVALCNPGPGTVAGCKISFVH